jgi:phage terminase large subunit
VWRKAAKADNKKKQWINLMMELIEKRGKTQGLVNELKKDEIKEKKKAEGKRFYFGAGEDVDRIRSALNHWWNYYDTFFRLLDNIENLEFNDELLQWIAPKSSAASSMLQFESKFIRASNNSKWIELLSPLNQDKAFVPDETKKDGFGLIKEHEQKNFEFKNYELPKEGGN